MRFSVFLCLLFLLSNHPGLKGHSEFSGDKEACRREGAATEMSNSLTSTTLPSLGNRGGDWSVCNSARGCVRAQLFSYEEADRVKVAILHLK